MFNISLTWKATNNSLIACEATDFENTCHPTLTIILLNHLYNFGGSKRHLFDVLFQSSSSTNIGLNCRIKAGSSTGPNTRLEGSLLLMLITELQTGLKGLNLAWPNVQGTGLHVAIF